MSSQELKALRDEAVKPAKGRFFFSLDTLSKVALLPL
jgi:hypothetical protein